MPADRPPAVPPAMSPYDELISLVEVFSEQYTGGLRIRGIKTSLLILKATLHGSGITLSELARQTNAPLENVRRHLAQRAERGFLHYISDPSDDRATRILFSKPEYEMERVAQLLKHLATIDWQALADEFQPPEKGSRSDKRSGK